MKDIIFTCPKCGTKFSFLEQILKLADEDGTPLFSEKLGVDFQLILCPQCDSHWILSLSEAYTGRDYKEINVK